MNTNSHEHIEDHAMVDNQTDSVVQQSKDSDNNLSCDINDINNHKRSQGHNYNLQNVERINYRALNDYGEIQLHQVEKQWYSILLQNNHKVTEPKQVNI